MVARVVVLAAVGAGGLEEAVEAFDVAIAVG